MKILCCMGLIKFPIRTMRKIKRFVQLINDPSIDPELMRAVTLLFHAYDTSFSMRSGVHYLLFKTALEGGGTEKQIKKYADDVQLRLSPSTIFLVWDSNFSPSYRKMRIMGCFGMTEFGGGSSIQQFETTATFDKNTDQFIIHRYLNISQQHSPYSQPPTTVPPSLPPNGGWGWQLMCVLLTSPYFYSMALLFKPDINTLIDGDTLYSICKADQ